MSLLVCCFMLSTDRQKNFIYVNRDRENNIEYLYRVPYHTSSILYLVSGDSKRYNNRLFQ